MKRKIITIEADLCNGCGDCIPTCPEGAIQMIDGKARLISDIFCDGLGACIGHCPTGAITIEEREAEEYNEKKVMENIVKAGKNTIIAHLKHLHEHGEIIYLNEALDYLRSNNVEVPDYEDDEPHGGCPGSKTMNLKNDNVSSQSSNSNIKIESELRQWPIQLQLLNPNAPYFKDADLLVAADCVPFAHADFHRKFLKGKTLVMFCPKLDKVVDNYIEKMAHIFTIHKINSITIVKMEVPCCGGTNYVVEEALKKAGKNIIIKEYTMSLEGDII